MTEIAHPTSALQLAHKKGGGVRCSEPGCHRVGRYAICIAGHFCLCDSLIVPKELLCKPCAEAARALWSELLGETAAPLEAAA